ncbi:MAG: hypothetical protein ABW166_02720 [Sedimenticola sp.]
MNRPRYAHSSIPAAVRPEKVSLHPPESYPSAVDYSEVTTSGGKSLGSEGKAP